MDRQSVMLNQEQIDDLRAMFDSVDEDGSGYIEKGEIQRALEAVNIKMPTYRTRDILAAFDSNQDNCLSFEEFQMIYAKCKEETDMGRNFKKAVSSMKNIKTHGGASEGVTHTVKDSEVYAFADWINKNLGTDPDCGHLLPINPETDDLFVKVKDGIILCKLINHSVENTIDERAINKNKPSVYLCIENLNLALNSAEAIGCSVTNIGHGDMREGKPHLVLGLLWQIIRIGLLNDINLESHQGLVHLLQEGETFEDLLKLSPEQILIRWVNYHLENAGEDRRISNFSEDIKDSEVYFHLLKQIAPKEAGVNKDEIYTTPLEDRAEAMLKEADKIGCRAFISPQDVVKGNGKLNLAFVANLFNTYPALEPVKDEDQVDIVDETREEKTYRNWMNSLGVNPHVNRLNADLVDGLILFQLYECIKKGSVDWNKVNKKFQKMKQSFQRIENCNYAVDLGGQFKFSLIGIGGTDIASGNAMLTLALVWQLMRAYTMSILRNVSEDGAPIEDRHIVKWANDKLKSCGKPNTVASFQDSTLSDGVTIINLIDCIAPGKVNLDLVKKSSDEADKMLNAKYAITMGRKIGARIYALPDDIVEVKQKMVMTIFACLMTVDFKKNNTQLKE